MADPVTLGLALAGGAVSAAGQMHAAAGQSAAARFQADRARRAAEIGRTKADQVDFALRDELQTTLENIAAVRASAGLDPNTPTAMAIREGQAARSDRERVIRRTNALMDASDSDRAAVMYDRAARDALLAGQIGAVGSMIGAANRGFGGKNPFASFG